MRLLLTGASGFVGSAVADALRGRGLSFTAAVRRSTDIPEQLPVGDIHGSTDWRSALAGCDAVIHLAARVHVLREEASDPLDAFRRVNAQGTLNLARQSAEAGVRRFVFLSTAKVHGEGRDARYCEKDEPAPNDSYAVSKLEAEAGLREIAGRTGMEVVILRPPLIYGPGVGGNFRRLLDIVAKGLPLPLGMINNQRSMLFLGNLTDIILECTGHPAAAGRTYLVSDCTDISTPELMRKLAQLMGRPCRLLNVPPGWLTLAGRLSGKSEDVMRLTGSLSLDCGLIRRELGWQPPYTLEQGLAETVRWYREEHAK